MIPPARPAPPWPAGCFWSGFTQPDIRHCEENLCGVIAAPADTWSNLFYFAAAFYLLRQPGRSSKLLGGCVAFIGLTSFIFHASYTFLFQVGDYAGMFCLVWVLFGLNLRRAGKDASLLALGAGGTIASTAVLVLAHNMGFPVQPVFALHLAALILSEAFVAKRSTDYRWFLGALALSAAGFACWMLDYTRVWCDPNDHLWQGHAAWHLLTALSFLPLARFYRQFDA